METAESRSVNFVRFVALMTGLLPIIAIHTTYLVSAIQGHVPWCFPYFESCTSISATGRHGAAYYIFKGTMIPAAVLLMLYWYLTAHWLRQIGDSRGAGRAIFVIGSIGAIFLIVYTVALGAAGDDMRLQRRIGIIFYFTLTYLSQLLLVWRIGLIRPHEPTRAILYALCATALIIGLTTIGLDLSISNYDDYEDAFEWILALLVHIYFLVSVYTWKNSGFRVRYATH